MHIYLLSIALNVEQYEIHISCLEQFPELHGLESQLHRLEAALKVPISLLLLVLCCIVMMLLGRKVV